MGFKVGWDLTSEDRLTLCYTVTGRWTWDEFYAARDQARQLADSADQAVIDSIIDLRDGSLFPQNALSHFSRMPSDSHPKLEQGIVVIIHNSLFIHSLIDIMRYLNPQSMTHFHDADSPELAHILLFQAHCHSSTEPDPP